MANPESAPKISYGVKEQMPAQSPLDERVAELFVNGCTVLPSGFDKAFIDALKPKMEAAYKTQVDEIGGEEQLKKINDVDISRALLAYDPIFVEVASCPALLELAKRILGDEIILVMQNGIYNRPDRENYQKLFHRDLSYQHWTSSRPLAINALLCVEDFTADNGATWVVPGTHQVEKFPTPEFCKKFERQIIAPAGSFLVLDAMLFHRAGNNRSDHVRRGINHILALPFFAQYIDFPRLLASKGQAAPKDPAIAKYLGYRWSPSESVTEWRKRRMP